MKNRFFNEKKNFVDNFNIIRIESSGEINKIIPTFCKLDQIKDKIIYFQNIAINDGFAIIELSEKKNYLTIKTRRKSNFVPNQYLKTAIKKQYEEHKDVALIVDTGTSKPLFDLIERKEIAYFYSRPPGNLKIGDKILCIWHHKKTSGNEDEKYTNIGLVEVNDFNLPSIAFWKSFGRRFYSSEFETTEIGSNFAFNIFCQVYKISPICPHGINLKDEFTPTGNSKRLDNINVSRLWEIYATEWEGVYNDVKNLMEKPNSEKPLLSNILSGTFPTNFLNKYNVIEMDVPLESIFKINKIWTSGGKLHIELNGNSQILSPNFTHLDFEAFLRKSIPYQYNLDVYKMFYD